MITKQGAIKRTTDGMRLVGRGTYDILLDEDRAPIAYGMAPKPLIDKIETMFRERIAFLFMKECGFPEDKDFQGELAKHVNPEVVNEALRQFHIGLLEGAKEAGNLLC